MSPEIRRVRDGELRAYLRTVSTASMEHPTDLDKVIEEIRGLWDLERADVDELHALTDDASAALWRFLTGTDWVATVQAERRSPSDRLPWTLTNARAASITEQRCALWVRLLDLPRAMEARTYAGEGSVVLGIVDPEASGGRWRVALDVGPDGARCTLTDMPDERWCSTFF